MKSLNLWLAVSALSHLAAALPSNTSGSTNSSFWGPPPDAPMGGSLITDPDRIAYLMTLHQDALDKMKNGVALPVDSAQEAADALVNGDPLEKRFLPIIGIGGLLLVPALKVLSHALEEIADALLSLFSGEDIVWQERGRCRAEYDTWAGWKGTFRSWEREKLKEETEWSEVK